MSHAAIYLEDDDQGAAAVRFVFTDGFNKESAAHQLTNIIKGKLDRMEKDGELTALASLDDKPEAQQLELLPAAANG